jgi:hypothetical protein
MTTKNQNTKWLSGVDGEIKFGEIDDNDVLNAVTIRNQKRFAAAPHYTKWHSSGKFEGGITHRCPSTYQVKCGNNPVDGFGYIVHCVDGDMILAAPSGRVTIMGETIDLIATGGKGKGNINIDASAAINMDAKKVNLKASAAINFVSSGVAHLKSSNNMYLTAGYIKASTNSSSPLAKLPTNMGPTEIVQTIKKILEFIS